MANTVQAINDSEIKISDRDIINRIVKDYAFRNKVEYSEAWKGLYDCIKWRLGENFFWKAHMESMKPLDYMEKRGLLPYMRAVVEQIYGNKVV